MDKSRFSRLAAMLIVAAALFPGACGPKTRPGESNIVLDGVWGATATDVFAVGNDGILHFDGSYWSTMMSDTSVSLIAVWRTSPADARSATSAAP
jgi:hypothetical protein